MPPYGAFPVKFQTSLDCIGLAFAMALGIVCGLLFGAAPALQLGRIDPQQALRSGSRSAGRSAIRDGLMGAAVWPGAAGAGRGRPLLRSFVETRDTDPGFRTEGLLLATYDLERHGDRRRLRQAVCDAAARPVAARCRRLSRRRFRTSMPLDIHGLPLRGFALEGRAQTDGATGSGAQQHCLAGLFHDDGDPVRGRRGLRRHAATASRRRR